MSLEINQEMLQQQKKQIEVSQKDRQEARPDQRQRVSNWLQADKVLAPFSFQAELQRQRSGRLRFAARRRQEPPKRNRVSKSLRPLICCPAECLETGDGPGASTAPSLPSVCP